MIILTIVVVTQVLALPSTYGYYIKSNAGKSKDIETLWNIYQQNSEHSSGSVKSQTDQANARDILDRFNGENNKYVLINEKTINRQKFSDIYLNIYRSLYISEKMNVSKQILKTSLNEIKDNDEKSTKDFKRSRRKIAVKMASDMPTEQIDELLKLFNRQHGIDSSESNKIQDELEANYDEINYFSMQTPKTLNADYMYENLYEDDQGAAASSTTNNNGEFKSLQDLLMQVTQFQGKTKNNNLRV